MSDISRLLLNKINELLSNLSKQGVGFINCENINTIEYQIDNRIFEIKVIEKER